MLWFGKVKDFKAKVIPHKFYVYSLHLEDQPTPIYIGKGSGRRASGHLLCGGASKALVKILKKNPNYYVGILNSSDDESVIYQLEKFYVQKFGKKIEGGLLINFSDGGIDSSSYTKTKEFREFKSKDYSDKYGKPYFVQGFIFPSKRVAASKLNTDRNHIDCLTKIGCAFEILEDWVEKDLAYTAYLDKKNKDYQKYKNRSKPTSGGCRKVVVDHIIYNSLSEAAFENGISPRAIGRRIERGNQKNTYYLEEYLLWHPI